METGVFYFFFFLISLSATAQHNINEKDHNQLPIKAERTVSFTTSEGSYMNIDVSPDGKQLLFDLLGDIHVVSSSGGKTRQLTRGIALKSNPLWSASGNTFTYLSDSDQKVVRYEQSLTGNQIVAVPDADILLGIKTDLRSPNGRYRAYIKDTAGTQAVVLYDSIRNVEKILIPSLLQTPVSYKGTVSNHFAFSPDSKSIYIGYGGKIHQVFVQDGTDKVIPFTAKIQADLGALVYNKFQISYDSFQIKYVRSVSLRNDGKQLVFSALGKVYIMNLPSGSPKLLADQDMNQFQPTYSVDGRWIAYVTWNDKYNGQLWIVKSNGGKPEQLTRISGNYQRPIWSPDSRYIAIIQARPTLYDRDDAGIGTLELVPTNGGEPKILEDSVPLWNNLSFSADGKKVIFQPQFKTKDSLGNGNMLVAKSVNGLTTEVLAEGPEDLFIQQRTISPDGKYLAYTAREDIYLLPIEEAKVVQLSVNNPLAIKLGAGVDPVWESNGQRLGWTFSNHFYSTNCEQSKKDNRIIGKEDLDLSINVESNHGIGVLALTGVRIITMKDNQIIDNGTILIKDGRILNVGKAKHVAIPQKATVYDLKGKTIVPGFIDLHLHMRLSPDIFPQQSWMFLANLAYGVTTARDPSLNFDSFGYAELLRSGRMLGPRLYTSGRAARIYDGLIALHSFEDARDLVKKRAVMGGSFVKQYMLPNHTQKQWLLMACRENGLNMTNEGYGDPFSQMIMIKDGSTGIEHNPVWGDVYNDVIKLLALSGTFYTPTIQVSFGTKEPGKEYFKYKYWKLANAKMKRFIKSDSANLEPTGNGAESLENIINAISTDTIDPGFLMPARINARMIKAGVKVGVGSHGNDQGIGVHNEIWALQMGGISNMQALRAATLTGAEAIGVQKDVGSLEVGKIADLIILNSNPLDDIHNTRDIQFVMKDGILYDGNTLDEVWPQKKKMIDYGR